MDHMAPWHDIDEMTKWNYPVGFMVIMENFEHGLMGALIDNNKNTEIPVLSEWQVTISENMESIEVMPAGSGFSMIKLIPIYLKTRDMTIVIPAESKEIAADKGRAIARFVLSAGMWGIEIWDPDRFLPAIENLL